MTHLSVDSEVECPEILPGPGVPVAELPQPPPVQPQAALDDERGERGAVAQLVAALIRTHGQAHLSESVGLNWRDQTYRVMAHGWRGCLRGEEIEAELGWAAQVGADK